MHRNRKAWLLAALLPLLAACAGRTDRTGEEGYQAPAASASGATAGAAQATPAPGATTPSPDTQEQSPTPTPAPAPAPAASEADVPRVPVTEARALQESGEAVLVDVRDPASFGAGHIAGALHIPLGEVTARAGELPRDKRIITYCS